MVIKDEVATELCGALKNIVAVAAGVIEGLGYGDNTKAAVIRLGFMEMKNFIYQFFADRRKCFLLLSANYALFTFSILKSQNSLSVNVFIRKS